jgi:hypothetical protein
MDKVHKTITTQYYTASSKPFRIYLNEVGLCGLYDTALGTPSLKTVPRDTVGAIEKRSLLSSGICRSLRRNSVPIRNTQPRKCTILLFLRYLHYNITLSIPICFDTQGIIIREPNQSNAALNQICHYNRHLTSCKTGK